MKFQITAITIAILVGIALFFLGRFTAPKKIDMHQHAMDSLRMVARKAHTLQEYYRSQAELAYNRGLADEKATVVHHTVYRYDTAANHRLRKHLKDSIIKAMFSPDPSMDQSMFSDPVANGVLDLKSENKMLKADDKADSSAIVNYKEAYAAKDSALCQCEKALEAQQGLTAIANQNTANEKKEAKKQGFLKWVGFGVAGIFAVLASTK